MTINPRPYQPGAVTLVRFNISSLFKEPYELNNKNLKENVDTPSLSVRNFIYFPVKSIKYFISFFLLCSILIKALSYYITYAYMDFLLVYFIHMYLQIQRFDILFLNINLLGTCVCNKLYVFVQLHVISFYIS